MNTALTIAGSDCSGGAGIQADIKTMIMNKVYAMSVITSITAQNTMGVKEIEEVSFDLIKSQLDAVFLDIFPDAVKIGMISSKKAVEIIFKKLSSYQAKNIVIDPVMVSTSGTKLLSDEAIEEQKRSLFPIATILTPNIPEIEVLTHITVTSEKDMLVAAEKLSELYGCAILCKGGHAINHANDLLYSNGSYQWFRGTRIDNSNTHGTGCTLSSAIAANLAKGYDLETAVFLAKEYISKALESMLNLGNGNGPINHGFALFEK